MYELKITFSSMSELRTFLDFGASAQMAVDVASAQRAADVALQSTIAKPATVTPEKQDAAIASAETVVKRGPGRPPKKDQEPPAPLQPPAETPFPMPGATPVEALAATLSYEADVAPLIAKAQARDRDATVQLLEDLGARDPETKKLSGKALLPAKYAEAIEKFTAIIDAPNDLT